MIGDEKLDNKCEICGTWYLVETHLKPNTKYHGKLLCQKHRNELKNCGSIRTLTQPKIPKKFRKCDYCGLSGDGNKLFIKDGENLCQRHYNQAHKYGKVLDRTRNDKNDIIIHDDYAEIILRNAKHAEVARAIIDIADVDLINSHIWHLSSGYARSNINGRSTALHRLLLDISDKNTLIDHRDRNKLNNRRNNLRVSDKSINSINSNLRDNNSSGVTGVSYSSSKALWRSYINYEGKRIELGWNKHKDDAIVLRLDAEWKYYRDDSPQLYLFDKYNIERV